MLLAVLCRGGAKLVPFVGRWWRSEHASKVLMCGVCRNIWYFVFRLKPVGSSVSSSLAVGAPSFTCLFPHAKLHPAAVVESSPPSAHLKYRPPHCLCSLAHPVADGGEKGLTRGMKKSAAAAPAGARVLQDGDVCDEVRPFSVT